MNGLSKSINHVRTALAIVAAALIAIGTMLYSLNGSVKSIEMQMTLQTSIVQASPAQTMPPARQLPPLSAETSSLSESLNAPSGSAGTEGGTGS
ncbi:MAG: hypothetical protein LBR80_06600 [Deltaproteobacteria bacterium]|nr:hypothetical protein [Deltaproteobacteria bacterium]